MPALRTTLPWLLLAASLAANIYLWPRPTSSSATHKSHETHRTYKSYSETPISSPTHLQSPTTPLASALTPSPPPNSQPSTLTSTATRSRAFEGYADLLAEEAKTTEQLSALNELLARWVATAPTDAATWLAQHDDTPFYDSAARHIALHLIAKQSFDSAATWADLIRDPALREEARDALIAESYRAKKIDAQAVRLSGLSPAHIESILNGSRLD
ncbi:hypothetical protein CMV30_11300 [Nibricoccus aquaticus]|uniref:Uncharacterized protein n=1 Tax=Nibricoccus aquaticus TaxID=2576891 RepID=A0A290QKT3_9BACT|nr:hypothetical protein [Nibricoccus aquaticus]ATC64492.1 hypothetical protein CMV30_11300 [Nibricoccus aquaticus]